MCTGNVRLQISLQVGANGRACARACARVHARVPAAAVAPAAGLRRPQCAHPKRSVSARTIACLRHSLHLRLGVEQRVVAHVHVEHREDSKPADHDEAQRRPQDDVEHADALGRRSARLSATGAMRGWAQRPGGAAQRGGREGHGRLRTAASPPASSSTRRAEVDSPSGPAGQSLPICTLALASEQSALSKATTQRDPICVPPPAKSEEEIW